MKRNGFTLVEMMAVIVLVALLAVIGVATYTNVNESAKEKTLESKKEQIRAAGIKWAKENNINYKTIISVNALVVEGYLTAEENEVGKIGVIENPVTGENMICNTVDISLKDGEYIAVLNDKEQNCTLATQSLVDTNINIKVVDEKNKDVTGSGSIAKWSNQNVMIIVSSSSYDSRATSISYDFEGNTVTKQKSGKQKYTGNAYISEPSADNYYNVFHVNANLILNTKIIVTYNVAGENSKSRAYTIRIDKEEATAIVETNSEWTTTDKKVTVKTDDGKGSGPRYFYITTTDNAADRNASNRYNATGYDKITKKLEIGKYYIWTEDRAGNVSTKPKAIFEVNNTDETVPACEVLFHGHEGDHGWYKEVPVTPGAKNTVKAGLSGMNIGLNNTTDPEYAAYIKYNDIYELMGPTRSTETSRTGIDYYCHVKTIAGNYAKAKRNLKLDMTPPTVNVTPVSDTEFSKSKTVKVTISDELSGLPSNGQIKYYWTKPGYFNNYSTISVNASQASSKTYSIKSQSDYTGFYYLTINYSGIKDYAGNQASNGGANHEDTFGPYYIDNTPPVCGESNSKTNWTKGGYTVTIKCSDDEGTDEQSGCTQDEYSKVFTATQTVQDSTIRIKDKAGNTRDCPISVYIDNTKPRCGLTNGESTVWTTEDRTIIVNCHDDHSGCERASYQNIWSSTFRTSSLTLKDNVGNTRKCTLNVYIDKTNPSCSTTKTSTGTGGVSGTISCSDSHSGVGSCNGGTTTFSGLKSGATYSVTDNVGNSNSCSVSVSTEKCNCSYSDWSGPTWWDSPSGDTSCNSYNYTGELKKRESCSKGTITSTGTYSCTCAIYTRTKSCDTCYK